MTDERCRKFTWIPHLLNCATSLPLQRRSDMRRPTVDIKPKLTEYLADNPEVTAQRLPDDGTFPNSKLPLLLYRKALSSPEERLAAKFEQLFEANDWRGAWRNGIYDYHHYHSTTHEVLGVFRGSARVQLGGDEGVVYDIG